MARIAYLRCSGSEQSVEAQRAALGGSFDEEFVDEGVSGAVRAADRPGFRELLRYARKGDSVSTYSVCRLGRDSIDVQATVRALFDKGVKVEVRGLGELSGEAGKIVLAVLAQLAEGERERIRERCNSGRLAARRALAETGLTHRGKQSLGRPMAADAKAVVDWRRDKGASISETARHFSISEATVSRYCAAA